MVTVDLERSRITGCQHPAALASNPDRHHVVTLWVECGQHAACGYAGDRVLVAAAAEQKGDPQLVVVALARLRLHDADPTACAALPSRSDPSAWRPHRLAASARRGPTRRHR